MGLNIDDKIVGIYVKRGSAEKTTYFERTFEQLGDYVLTLRSGDEVKFVIKTKGNDGVYGNAVESSSVILLDSDFTISKDNAL